MALNDFFEKIKNATTRTTTRNVDNNISGTANDGMNLSGVNNISSARGTPKVAPVSTGPTGINTDASNLAGTNNIRNAIGTPSVNTEKGKNFTETYNKPVNSAVVKTNANQYQNTLSSVADASSKAGQRFLNNIGDTFNIFKNDVSDYFIQNKQNAQNTQAGLAYQRLEAQRQDAIDTDENNRNEIYNSITQEDYNKFFNQDGSAKDFDSSVRSLRQQIDGFNELLNSEIPDTQRVIVQDQLAQAQSQLAENEDLLKKYKAYEEKSNLDYYQSIGDEDTYNSLREAYSHKNDNMAQRFGTAMTQLVAETINEIPQALEQLKLTGQSTYATQSIDELNALHNTGQLSDDAYAEGLKYWNDALNEYRNEYNDGFSQVIKEASTQLQANTYYDASQIETFVLQAGYSTAQFLEHYAIGLATAGAATGALALETGGQIATGTMSLASAVSKTNQLIEEGYSPDIAYKNGLLTGLVSYATEKVGMDRFVEMLGTPISVNALGQIIQTNLRSAMSEGLEEVVEGIVDPLVDSVTLGTDYEVNGSELLMSFALGGTSGLLMATGANVGSMINSSIQVNDLIRDMRQNRAETFNEIGRLRVNTREQYNKLANEVGTLRDWMSSMTDTQLEVANELINQAETALNEYAQKSTTMGVVFSYEIVENPTPEQNTQTIYEACESDFNQEVQTERSIDELQAQVDSDIEQLAMNEINFNNATQETLNRNGYNIDARVFNSLSEEQQNQALVALDTARALGINAGITIDLPDGVNGYVQDGFIIVDGNKKPILSTLSHELTHGTENSNYYEALKNLVKTAYGDNWENAVNQKIRDYSAIQDLDYEGAEKEVVARYVEDKLGDEKFMEDLIRYNYSLASKIWQNLKSLGVNEETAQIRNAFEKAFVDAQEKMISDSSLRFSAGGQTGLSALLYSEDPNLRAYGQSLSEKLDKAIQLDREGLTPEWSIWDETGWIKKADGLWRFQFYDGADKTFSRLINYLSRADGKTVGWLDDILELSDFIGEDNILFKMYPDLKDVAIYFYADQANASTLGRYDKGEDLGGGYRVKPSISINLASFRNSNGYLNLNFASYENIAETFFHELQHAIQVEEGFEDGSNLTLGAREYLENNSKKAREERDRLVDELLKTGLNERQINNAIRDYKTNYESIENELSKQQKEMIYYLVGAIDDINSTSAPYEKAFEIYNNNLGEIEAREEARRALSENDRKVSPEYDGRLKPDFLKDSGNSEFAFENDKGDIIVISNEELQKNRNDILKKEPIEINDTYGLSIKDGRSLRKKVLEFFNNVYNGRVQANVVGTVVLDNRGVKNDLAHGISTLKSKAFIGVPEVLRTGLVTDLRNDYNGKAEDRIIISAPVTIDGVDYIENVILRQTSGGRKKGDKTTKLYLHDIALINKESGKMTFIDPDLNISGETDMPGSWPSDTTSKFSFSLDKQNVNSEGVELTPQQQSYFKNSKVRDDNGNLLVVYHGTPNGTFNEFNNYSYFTANPDYAERYTDGRSWNGNKNAKVYKGYLNITKPFDIINDPEAENIFINEYIKGGYANGIDPGNQRYINDMINEGWGIDWTEADSLIEFLQDNGYDYDGLVLNEGADGGYGEPVVQRGNSYVIFNPNQFKNIDNTNPTSNSDIRFSLGSTDNEGRTLSKEQQDYFKDSKVKDENGNLMTMYHGTRGDFTVFDLAKGGESNSKAGIGFWFTPSKQGATNFANDAWYGDGEGKAMETYLNITNPYVYEEIDNTELLESIDKQTDEIADEIKSIKETTNYVMMDNIENRYYVNTLPNPVDKLIEMGYKEEESKLYVEQYQRIKELQQLQKQLKQDYYNNRYTDPYEQFRTDIYKLAGQSADEANVGGIGMGLNNPKETLQKYRDGLIEQGYDGIVIRGTRYDSDTFGGENDQYVAFYPEQIKNANNTNPTTNPDIRFSYDKEPSADSRLREFLIKNNMEEYYQGIDDTFNQYLEENDIQPNEVDLEDLYWYYAEPYSAEGTDMEPYRTTGEQEQLAELAVNYIREKYNINSNTQEETNRSQYYGYGMNPARNVDILRETEAGPTSRYWNNLANSQYVSDEEAQRIKTMVENGLGAYERTSREKQETEAKKLLRNMGMEDAFKYMMNADSVATMSVDNTLGRLLQSEMRQKGLEDTDGYRELSARMQWRATMQGQALEAWKGYRDSTPEGQIVTIRSEVERIQQGLNERYGDRANNIVLNEDLIAQYLRARNDTERDSIKEQIARDVAKQIPPSALEQLNSFRHLSMLFNPRTWVKNNLANRMFGYINEGTRTVRSVMETVLSNVGGSTFENLERQAGTYNPLSSQDRALYKRFKSEYGNEFKNIDMKYSQVDAGNILLGTEFGEEVSRYRDQFTSKFLNKLSKINAKMMSDAPGMSTAYAKSMVGYLKANNLDINNMTEEQLKKAKDFAINEAKYATFNSYNKLASDIAKFSQDGSMARRVVVESFLPFKRTPLNLLRTGFRYTPVGLADSMTRQFAQLKNGNITANDWINNVAQGMTGSALMVLGMLLSQMGLFRTKDDDPDRKQYLDQELGEQEYSLNWDGASYTIDWIDPMIVPLAMGAELIKYVQRGEYSLDDAVNMVAGLADPMFETSMLSGISKNLSSYSTGTTQWWGKIAQNAVTNYVSQYIPSVLGATARTIDSTRRSTYTDKGAIDRFVRTSRNKIPGLSQLNEPYINRGGEEERNEDLGMGIAGRAVLNFLSPGYYSSKEIDEYDEEMYRLYDTTGEIDSLPSNSSKSLTFDGENYKFTPEQYTEWQRTRWSTEAEYVNQFMDSQAYKNLDDAERVATIKDIRSYAQKVAKKQFLESQGIEYNDDKQLNNAQGAMNNGIELYAYFDYLNNGGSKQAEKMAYLEQSGLSQAQKEYLWSLNGYKKSYADVYASVFGASSNSSSKNKKSSNSSKKSSSGKISLSGAGGESSAPVGSSGATALRGGTGRANMVGAQNISPISNRDEENDFVNRYLSAYTSSINRGNNISTGNASVVCPNCGNRVNPANGRCPVCGNPL